MPSKQASVAAYRRKIPKELLREIDVIYAITSRSELQKLDPREMLLKQHVNICKDILEGLWSNKRLTRP
jgi:hypothetical protein